MSRSLWPAFLSRDVFLHDERNDEHAVLDEGAYLAPECFAPVELAVLGLIGLFRKPSRNAVLVIEILSSKDRLEDAFLVAHYETVLGSEEKDCDGQEPDHAR